ncbi:unnamed protein product, partial [marine sediment metagenome]
MHAAVYYNNKDIRIEDLPKPRIGPDEILVKVIASGICGSDVMEWYRIKKAPRILGHEISGEIEEVGKNVNQYKVGDRVFVSHHVPCNECRYCRGGFHTVCDTLKSTNFDPGGFAQFIRVPEINVRFGTFILPDEVSFDEGTFIEHLAQNRRNIDYLISQYSEKGILDIPIKQFMTPFDAEYKIKVEKKHTDSEELYYTDIKGSDLIGCTDFDHLNK